HALLARSLSYRCPRPDPPSFPTRRSSDLHLRRRRLRQEAAHTGLQRTPQVPRPTVAGDDDAAARGQLGREPLGDREPVQPGHLQVEQRDVGLVAQRGRERLVPGAGDRDHLEVVLQREQRRDGVADQRLVVGEQHPDRHAGSPPRAVIGTVASTTNVPSSKVAVSAPPRAPSRSRRPRSPLPPAGTVGSSGAPSFTTRTRQTSPATRTSMSQRVAWACRTTLVTASRTTQATASATGAGSCSPSPATRHSIAAERSSARAPAISVSRSAER